MRKTSCLLLCLLFCLVCGPKQNRIERIFEDGVEVVINHLEPYVIDSEPFGLKTERTVLIDFESERITELGIADIRGFDIDSENNLYVSVFKGEYNIYKFDKNGEFLKSFARRGQGPGELFVARSLSVNENDEILTENSSNQNYMFFDHMGNLIDEIPLPFRVARIYPLAEDKYLIARFSGQRRSPFYYRILLTLYDSEFREIKQLDDIKIPNGPGASYWTASKDRIYVGSEERGYEIWIFDLEGNLIRKIRKKYTPVELPENLRESWKKVYDSLKQQTGSQEEYKIPASWPPFFAFFVDNEGRLFVRTFEEGENRGEIIHDVFNSEGVFIGRVSFNLSYTREYKYVKTFGQKIYGFSEKENGYKELVFYTINGE